MVDKSELNPDGHDEAEALAETETQEELQAVKKHLDELMRGDGQVVTMTKQQLSLLHKMITPPEGDDSELMQVLAIADFMDDNEADDELAAYFEAKRLHMDTSWNIAHMLSRCAVNRKGAKTNRVGQILESLSHQKFTTNMPRYRYDNRNSRSLISER